MNRQILKSIGVSAALSAIMAVLLAATPMLTILSKNDFQLPFEGYYPPVIDVAYVVRNISAGWMWSFLCFFPGFLVISAIFHFIRRLTVGSSADPEKSLRKKLFNGIKLLAFFSIPIPMLIATLFLYMISENNNQGEIFSYNHEMNIDHGYLTLFYFISFSTIYAVVFIIFGVALWFLRCARPRMMRARSPSQSGVERVQERAEAFASGKRGRQAPQDAPDRR